jgi:hypothetical protein
MSVTTDDSADTAVQHKRATVRPEKADAVAELAEAFRGASAAVLTEYRGLTVKQISDLRTALGADTSYAVVKNTLTKIAAADAGLEGVDALLSGPTRGRVRQGRARRRAKALRDFARAHPALVVKGRRHGRQGHVGRRRPQARRPRVPRGSARQDGRGAARVAVQRRLPVQRAARPGRPPRGCAAGQGHRGPVDPAGRCRYGRRRPPTRLLPPEAAAPEAACSEAAAPRPLLPRPLLPRAAAPEARLLPRPLRPRASPLQRPTPPRATPPSDRLRPYRTTPSPPEPALIRRRRHHGEAQHRRAP